MEILPPYLFHPLTYSSLPSGVYFDLNFPFPRVQLTLPTWSHSSFITILIQSTLLCSFPSCLRLFCPLLPSSKNSARHPNFIVISWKKPVDLSLFLVTHRSAVPPSTVSSWSTIRSIRDGHNICVVALIFLQEDKMGEREGDWESGREVRKGERRHYTTLCTDERLSCISPFLISPPLFSHLPFSHLLSLSHLLNPFTIPNRKVLRSHFNLQIEVQIWSTLNSSDPLQFFHFNLINIPFSI